MRPILPLVSVTAIVVAGVVAASAAQILIVGPLVPAIVHNPSGLLLGYGVGWFPDIGVARWRAISFEVGMRNSGLAADELRGVSALPGAVFSVWGNISGPLPATYRGHRPERVLYSDVQKA